jgi:hypothetical protein
MKRSCQNRPHLRLTRTYTAEFTGSSWFESLPREYRRLRSDVLTHAANKLNKPHVTIRFDLGLDDDLTLEISASVHVPTVDRIPASSLEDVKGHADKAFGSVQQLIKESIGEVRAEDRTGARIFRSYDYFVFQKLLEHARFQLATSIVDFSVEPQVAAAIRDPTHLKKLTACSVHDYYHERNKPERPDPCQYSITQSEGPSLRITAREEGVAEGVATALLGEPRGQRPARRSIDGWPPPTTPYWGVGTLALAIFAVAIAVFRITPAWLAVTAAGTIIAVAITLIMARRDGADTPKTALGMSPSTIVLGFAVYYGLLMRGSHPSVTVTATHAPHLVDAFLLSLGMASTGGFFDIGLHTTTVRVVAFAETLLMVSVAGGSLYVGARAAWDRLGDMVRINVQG